MTRFYFDIHDGQRLTSDNYGGECDNLDDAGFLAQAVLADVARELTFVRGVKRIICQVRDKAGKQVLTSRLTIETEWTAPSNLERHLV